MNPEVKEPKIRPIGELCSTQLLVLNAELIT